MTVIVLGVAWFTLGTLEKAAPTDAEREMRTGEALREAKHALLAYVAQYAARPDTQAPGRLPYPECPTSIGTPKEGQAADVTCSPPPTVGRLPWETLGIDQLRDGWGEPLWYVLGPGFRSAPINFGTPGGLSYTDNGTTYPAVALIIAPGTPLDTTSYPGTPPSGCSKVDQQVANRNTAPLNPANFLECGNVTGSNPANPGSSQWTNDRVIAITPAEWANAIAGAVADRIQRQVAPALENWDATEAAATGKSWSTSYSLQFLPFASTFSDPATNDYCGDAGAIPTTEGLPPIASTSTATCASTWTGSASPVLGLINLGCTSGTSMLQCRFFRFFGTPPFSAQITATAQHVAGSFRGTIVTSDISVTGGGTANISSMSISSTSGAATAVVNVSWPASLALFSTVTVSIPNLADAVVLSNSNVTWFTQNQWQRYTYYAIAPGASLNPPSACTSPGDPGCLILAGMPASNGNSNDKRLILTLMGPGPVASESQPSNNASDYLESHTVGSSTYTAATVTSTYNDRLAACPFQYTPSSGSPIQVCN